jgi:Na+/proline symporter
MSVSPIDIAILLAYFAATIVAGFWVSKRGSKDLDSYFLGGKSLPWNLLGISDASGMFDISGTMLMVYWLFAYGLKSIWLPFMWPVFNQIFLMMFLSAWLRRSNVLTGAEWIQFRFGRGTGANLAHLSVVFFAIVNTIGMLAFAFKGIGKFAVTMLPWQLSAQTEGLFSNENLYAILILMLTSIYVIKGGMVSVVITEVMQFTILTVTSIIIGMIAIYKVSPEVIRGAVPDGWFNPFFGWKLDLDWTGIFDSVNNSFRADGNEWFGIVFGLMFFKGMLGSLAGPAPNYDMQRVLATRNPREACMMNGMVCCVLYFPRYMMIAGITLLALAFCLPELRAMEKPDFERLLPIVLAKSVPAGVVGLMLAGLLAAFMSNFAATINAAPAYLVNDIYKRHLDEPRRVDRRAGSRNWSGTGRHSDHRHDALDHRRALQRLCDGQCAQVDLVAVQRLRIFLGHDGRHLGSDVHPRVRARYRATALCAGSRPCCHLQPNLSCSRAPGTLHRRLPGRHLPEHARRRGDPQALLPHHAALGFLGADPRRDPPRRSNLRAQLRFLQGHDQRHGRHRLANVPYGATDLHRAPLVGLGRRHAGRAGRDQPIYQVQLVRQTPIR